MKAKIISVLVLMLLIATTLPAVGIMNIGHTTKTEPNDPQPLGTKIGYLSVPAAALVAEQETTNFYNVGSSLAGDGWFYAPVHLLQGATVTKLTFYWYDASTLDARCILIRYPFGGAEEYMAEVNSFGSSGNGIDEENTIVSPVIDNTGYGYFLAVRLRDNGLIVYDGVIIEYSYETGGSSEEDLVENEQSQVFKDYTVPLREP
jgi:hypothetical protein